MRLITSFENTLTRSTPDWLVCLALRFGLAVPFFMAGLRMWSGIGKIDPGTLQQFRSSYELHVLGKLYDYPYPDAWAYAAAIGAILFPVLLAIGLFGRFAAFGLLVMTLFITLTLPAGWPIHLSWAAMALSILVLGSGRLSADHMIMMRG